MFSNIFKNKLIFSSIIRTFDVENKENNLKLMDEFVGIIQKIFKGVVMNQSVRGKKVKKEKEEMIVETIVEDYTESMVLLFSGKLIARY